MASTPEEYLCPINLTIMNDPVIGSDGRSYERAAITQWLRSSPRSPMTREQMTVASLKPNYALKTAIERFNAEQRRPAPVRLPAPSAPPADDVYYAIQVHQQEVMQQQLFLPKHQTIVMSLATAETRRKKAIMTCICVLLTIIVIIVVSRVYISINN